MQDGKKTFRRLTSLMLAALLALAPAAAGTASAASAAQTQLEGVTIEGMALAGQELRAVLDPEGATATYEWVRRRASDGRWITIPGETSSTYTITPDDVGANIFVRATGTGSSSGTVRSGGTALIKAAASDVRVTGVTLTPATASLKVGETAALTATVAPANASVKTVQWASSDESVATVSESGEIKAMKEGRAVITVTTDDGGFTADCTVTVTQDSGSESPGPSTPPPESPGPSADPTESPSTSPSERPSSPGTPNVPVAPITPEDPTPSKPGDDTTTTVEKNDDGSTTTTVTDNKTGTVTETTEKEDGTVETVETRKDGTVTETMKNTDGSTEVVETKPDGTVTETNTDAEGGKVEKVTDPEKNVAITVTDAEGEVLAQVELPAEIPELETRFEDVPEGHWADQAIHSMAALEVVKGVGDDRFDMDGDMTRGALATVLSRLSNGQEGLESSFADVPSDEWYADGIAWAARTGIVTGYSETEFGPNDTITREQLAVMLCRYARLLGMDTTADSAALDSFGDGSSIHDWATDSIAWCVANGILRGMGNETLAPTATATRAQVAVMLQRFIDLMK